MRFSQCASAKDHALHGRARTGNGEKAGDGRRGATVNELGTSAAWLGLTPRQNSSGGKARLGKTSKMGQRDLRRLLIIGAAAVVQWAVRKGAPAGSWLARMLARKPRMLVAVALANRMARVAWALMIRGGVYRVPVAAA